jgi:hypothetical protein
MLWAFCRGAFIDRDISLVETTGPHAGELSGLTWGQVGAAPVPNWWRADRPACTRPANALFVEVSRRGARAVVGGVGQ